ncbi:MAG: lipid-A-disaccharide synthase N-terminal domain-containing protein [Steroidobacteraceae bacterium]
MQGTESLVWIVIGFIGQALFSARFVVQWFASEQAKRSVIPVAFWYFSLGGGVVLLAYAIHKRDPVFIAGQGLGLLVYFRNLFLLRSVSRQPEAESGG